MEKENTIISKKEQVDILYREAEIKEKLKNITLEAKKHKNEEAKVAIDKVKALQELMESYSIDESRQIPGCEIALKNTFTEGEIYTLKNKIFEIIKKF